MIWVWIVIGALAALIIVPVVIGLFLPEVYVGQADRRFEWTPEEVWAAIHDAAKNPVSGRQCRGVESAGDSVELPSGPNDRDESSLPNWIEDMGSTKITVTTIESDRPKRVVRHFKDSVVPMTAESIITIEADGGATKVTVENTITIKRGTWHVPIFRFMMTIMNGARRGCSDYLKNLKRPSD